MFWSGAHECYKYRSRSSQNGFARGGGGKGLLDSACVQTLDPASGGQFVMYVGLGPTITAQLERGIKLNINYSA